MKAITKKRITRPFLSLTPYLVSIAFHLLLIVVVCIVETAANPDSDNLSGDYYVRVALQFGGELIGSLFVCGLVKSRNNTRFRETISVKKFDVSVPIMLTIFTIAAGEVCDQLDGLILSSFMTVEHDVSPVPFDLSGVIIAVVLAPIFEEILFRFSWCELCRDVYPVPVICIVSGLHFGLVHSYNIQGIINVTLTGIALAYVYCKTRNLLYVMLTHALHNAICFIPMDWGYYEKNGFSLGKWWWVLICAVLTAVCVLWYVKVFRKKYCGQPVPESEVQAV